MSMKNSNKSQQDQEMKSSFDLLLTLAKTNDAVAQYGVVRCFFSGLGTTKNYRKAVEWYTKAAQQGHLKAQCCLAKCF